MVTTVTKVENIEETHVLGKARERKGSEFNLAHVEYEMREGHFCEDGQKAGKYMDPEFGSEVRAGGVDLGVCRVTVQLGEWLRYGRLTKDIYMISYPNITSLAFSFIM